MTITKNMTLSATSQTTDGQVIAYHSATISTGSQQSQITMTIANQDLYKTSKTQVRADATEFATAVYEVEDSGLIGTEEDI